MPTPLTAPDHLPARGTGISDDQVTELPHWEGAEAADRDSAEWDPAEPVDWDPAESADWDPAELAGWEPGDPEGDSGWFAAGGVADDLLPGPPLAGFMADARDIGLGRLTDDELIGVMRAARRLASWSAATELAAAGDLWRRRWAEEQAGNTGAACHADDEIAAALALTRRAAMWGMSLIPSMQSSASTTCSAAIRCAACRVRGGRSTSSRRSA